MTMESKNVYDVITYGVTFKLLLYQTQLYWLFGHYQTLIQLELEYVIQEWTSSRYQSFTYAVSDYNVLTNVQKKLYVLFQFDITHWTLVFDITTWTLVFDVTPWTHMYFFEYVMYVSIYN
jgi:hypothetical protein